MVWILLGAMVACQISLGQSTFGSVVGTVTDSTGKVIAGAAVTLTATETNVKRSGLTRDNGVYEFPNLIPGRYQVAVEHPGFSPSITEPFALEARATERQDVELALAGVTASVTVTAALVNADNPMVSSAVTNKELTELPYNFRTENTSPLPSITVLPEVQMGNGQNMFSLSGGMAYQNEISVDGIMTNSVRDNGVASGEVAGRTGGAYNMFPSMEGIREVRVSSVSNSAEFVQMGDLTTITKSGSNEFHGSAFWNYNGNALNANPNYFTPDLVNPRRVNNDAGGSFGGPVTIPHVYNGHNRTFFFADYERLTIYSNTVSGATVPTADERKGLISSATPLINPLTGSAFATDSAGRYIVPVNSVSQKVLDKLIPAPNVGTNLYRFGFNSSTESNQYDIRGDQNFSSRHSIFARWTWKNSDDLSPDSFLVTSPLAMRSRSRNLAVADTYALRPNLLNEFRFGLTNADFDRQQTTTVKGADIIASLGLNSYVKNLPANTGTPYIQIAGYTNFGIAQPDSPIQRTLQFADNVTYSTGAHSFKAGVDFRRLRWSSRSNFTGADDFGVYSFDAALTGGTGNAVANFLLGLPSDSNQTASGPLVDGHTWHQGYFFQDDWRVSQRVTLNLGIRYDIFEPFTDAGGNITNFLRNTKNGDVVVPDEASLALAKPAFTEGIGTAKIYTAAQVGLPKTLRNTDLNNFAPRIGVAWRPLRTDRLVIRGGYGMYYTRILGDVFNSLTGIHTSDNVDFVNTYNASAHSYSMIWPNTSTNTAASVASPAGSQNFSTANDPNYKDPYTQQWSFTIERQLTSNQAVRVTYTGYHTEELTLAPDLNQIQPNTIGYKNMFISNADGSAMVVNPALGIADPRPYPNWHRVNTRDNGGMANYDDLTVQFTGALRRSGLHYSASYKFAKGITNVEPRNGGANFINEISSRTDDRFDTSYQRGQIQAIPNHRVTGNFVWNVPFGRSRAFGSHMSRWADAVAGGWSISNITTMQTGQHLSGVYSGYCGSGTNCYGNEAADVVGGQDANSGTKTTAEWFNTGAFSTADLKIKAVSNDPTHPGGIYPGRFGNAGKGSILGPGIVAVDAAMFKDFAFTERTQLRLETQITNIINHANFDNPVTDVNSVNYGQVLNTLTVNDSGARRVLLGLRLTF
jgi:hypothetical protein